ncbi:MAG: L,D-transpeptidase [Paenibacillaceae bacterium]
MEHINEEGEGPQPEARFNNHLKSNLIRLHKNLYLNRTDPRYFEKILHYADPKSPEAHYMLAQKYEKEDNTTKALFHYQEAAKDKQSAFYAKAKDSIRRIQKPIPSSTVAPKAPVAPSTPLVPVTSKLTISKTSLFILLLFNLALLLLLFNLDSVRAVVSSIVDDKVGMEVVYETVDTPYVIYIPESDARDKVESKLYRKAYEMGKASPNHNIQLYGIITHDASLQGTITPLISESLKNTAFVIAQYNASVDQAVKIQYQSKAARPAIQSQPANSTVPAITLAASNLVRTALAAYLKENTTPPAHIESLASEYPNNYLSFIPNEAQSGSNQVVQQFDGKGGWVYHPLAASLSSKFFPNITNEPTALQAPYSPIKLLISKDDHTLMLVSGSVVLASMSIGAGKENRTPDGSFTIQDRVMNPLGKHPNVYGQAGLSMGKYAIHGTFDSTSIAANKSLGCVRVSNEDILTLFPLVPKGADVEITNSLPSAYKKVLLTDPTPLIPSQKPQISETAPHKIFNWLGFSGFITLPSAAA